MNKIKSFPAIASLVLRLSIGISYISILYQGWQTVGAEPWYLVALVVIMSVATLFLILGFMTRWAALTIIVYYVVLAIAYGNWSSFLYIFLQGSPVAALIAVWFLNSGKFSIDHAIGKKKMAPAAAPMA